MRQTLSLAIGVAGAAGFLYAVLKKPIEVKNGVRSFTPEMRKKIVIALKNTSLDSAFMPGQFAMKVTAPIEGNIPTIKMIQSSISAGLGVYASDSAIDLTKADIVPPNVFLIVADPSEAFDIAGPDKHFAELTRG